MKLSTRARYGTRALLDLALHSDQAPVKLKNIARRQNISLHYLEHIITPLIGADIIKSQRGAGGGLWLGRPAGEIRLSEVVGLLEGSMAPVECISSPEVCNRSDWCATRDIWAELKQAIDGVLESITLEDLAERQKTKERATEGMYHI